MPCTFVTGPVRSGKSRFAERLAVEAGGGVTYVATSRIDVDDDEWAERLARHVARRPTDWRVVETALPGAPELATLAHAATAAQTLLVDSLGTWLADRMSRQIDGGATLDVAALERELVVAVDALAATSARAIVVGEEVGWGVVPEYASGRVFRDVLGRGQARLAAGATHAYLVVAGFALDLHAGRAVE